MSCLCLRLWWHFQRMHQLDQVNQQATWLTNLGFGLSCFAKQCLNPKFQGSLLIQARCLELNNLKGNFIA